MKQEDFLLNHKIEEVRRQLYVDAVGKPLTDPEVVKLSESLDQLLNEYYALQFRQMAQRMCARKASFLAAAL